MMNGINFGMDGLTLDGTTWFNEKTGDSFTVRSNFFEDNNMILMTTDGRKISYAQLSGYVQVHGQVPKKPKDTPKPNKKETLPPEVANILETEDNPGPDSFIDPEDLAMINGANMSTNNPKALKQDGLQLPQHYKPKTTNHDIIERALSKAEMPKWNIAMKWTNFPKREIEMLTEVMDVPMEEVTNYYLDKITSEFDEFMNGIGDQLKEYLTKKVNEDKKVADAPEKKTSTKRNARTSKTK